MVKSRKYWPANISHIVQYVTVIRNMINISQYFTLFYNIISKNISCKYFRWYFTYFTWYLSIYLCNFLLCCDIFDSVSQDVTRCLPLNFTKIFCILFFMNSQYFMKCCTQISDISRHTSHSFFLHHHLTASPSGALQNNHCTALPGSISTHVSFGPFFWPVPRLAPQRTAASRHGRHRRHFNAWLLLEYICTLRHFRENPRQNALLALFRLICIRQEEILSNDKMRSW